VGLVLLAFADQSIAIVRLTGKGARRLSVRDDWILD